MRFLQSVIQDSNRPLQASSSPVPDAPPSVVPSTAPALSTPGPTRVQKPSSEQGTQRVVARTAADGHRPEARRAEIPLAPSEPPDDRPTSESAQRSIRLRNRDDKMLNVPPTFDDTDRDLTVALESQHASVDVSESDIAFTTTHTTFSRRDESAMPPNPDHSDPSTEPEIESTHGRENLNGGRQATGSTTPSEPPVDQPLGQPDASRAPFQGSDLAPAPDRADTDTPTEQSRSLSDVADVRSAPESEAITGYDRYTDPAPFRSTDTAPPDPSGPVPEAEPHGVKIGQVDITLQQDVRPPARRPSSGSAFNTRRFLSRNYLRRL